MTLSLSSFVRNLSFLLEFVAYLENLKHLKKVVSKVLQGCFMDVRPSHGCSKEGCF